MSEDASARLGLPYLAAGQMQKHVTLNEALTRLDALVQLAVVSRTTTSAPTAPDDGALYILPGGASGEGWSGRVAGTLVRAEGGHWQAVPVAEGALALVLDTGELLMRRVGDWSSPSLTAGVLQGLSRLGVNTTADAENPLAVKTGKALFAALGASEGGDGDLRVTFNKESPADVLSLLFQSGWSGRAEIGLTGDDDLRIKVSSDGAVWLDVLAVDRTSGRALFAQGAMRSETTVLGVSGPYVPPAWARWVEVTAVGGGGGGGAGGSGLAQHGGAGGGAGGMVTARWPASELDDGLSVTVGAGGTGGATSGQAGADGGWSRLVLSGVPLLTAGGGGGGSGGGATPTEATPGGLGDGIANRGGVSLLSATARGGDADSQPSGPGGGGGGGALDGSGAARAGGLGGDGGRTGPQAAGGAAGVAGAACPAPVFGLSGGGGGGGNASASAAGTAGGAGGDCGAGGGGGGAGVSGGGAGGAGANGQVRITAWG